MKQEHLFQHNIKVYHICVNKERLPGKRQLLDCQLVSVIHWNNIIDIHLDRGLSLESENSCMDGLGVRVELKICYEVTSRFGADLIGDENREHLFVD